MTTNFDFLIENALLRLGVSKKNIIPVITKDDFLKYSNPNKLMKKKKKTVYKIHGSTKNVISGKDTRDSLVATIQAFGSNKEGENVFQVEPFKQKLFENISNGRSMVVMGYSGSDDFDIVPTLKVLKNIRNIVWINHSKGIEMGKEEIREIDASASDSKIESDKDLIKVSRILLEIKQENNANHVYQVDMDTMEMVKELLDARPKLSTDNFSITSEEWLENNIETPSKLMKHYIPYKIYYDFDLHDDNMRCSKEILHLAEESGNQSWKSIAINNIGMIYEVRGQYKEALERYEEALKIDEQLGDLPGRTSILNNIGKIYQIRGQYDEALKRFEEALKIDEQLGDLSEKATDLNNIGSIYEARGQYEEALERYEEAIKIDEQLGNLSKKAIRLNNIGLIYRVRGQYNEALKRYEEALKIAEQLGNLKNKAIFLNNIGGIYADKGRYDEALERYNEALKIAEQLGDLSGKATDLNNIASIHYAQKNYPKAIKRFEEALQINEQLGDLSKKAGCLNNIGMIYKARGQYDEALERCEEALKIHEQLGELSRKAKSLNNIGIINGLQGNYNEALKWHEKALKILISLGLSESPDAKLYKENIEFVKSKM